MRPSALSLLPLYPSAVPGPRHGRRGGLAGPRLTRLCWSRPALGPCRARVVPPPALSGSTEAPWQPGGAAPQAQRHSYFATCSPGLEELVAAELASPRIRADSVRVGSSGVYFAGDLSTGYSHPLTIQGKPLVAMCRSRAGAQILHTLAYMQLASGHLDVSMPAGDSIYSFVREAAPWPALLVPAARDHLHLLQKEVRSRSKATSIAATAGAAKSHTFSVECRVWDCTTVSSSQLAATRAKDAICDALCDAYDGHRPDPPAPAEAELPLFLSLFRNKAVLYRDMSGRSLHKRGYRKAMHRASLNEGIAAAMLTWAGWRPAEEGSFPSRAKNLVGPEDSNYSGIQRGPCRLGIQQGSQGALSTTRTLLDPMCGSGTLLIEAALMAASRAPGLLRHRWPFETWPDFKASEWHEALAEAAGARSERPEGLTLLGNDIHPGALSLCDRHARAAGVRDWLHLSNEDCRKYTPPARPSLVIVNPPWGSRLVDTSGEEGEWLGCTWQALGLFLKRACSNANVFVLSGNAAASRELRMKACSKWTVNVGGIECRLLHYRVLPQKGSHDPQGQPHSWGELM